MEEQQTKPAKDPWLTKKEWRFLIATAVLTPVGQEAFGAAKTFLLSLPLSGASAVAAGVAGRLVGSLWATIPAALVFIVLRRHVATATFAQAMRQRDHLLMAADLIEARLKALETKSADNETRAANLEHDVAVLRKDADGGLRSTNTELHLMARQVRGDFNGLAMQLDALGSVRKLAAMLLDPDRPSTWAPFPQKLPKDEHNAILLGHHLGVFEVRDMEGIVKWRRLARQSQ